MFAEVAAVEAMIPHAEKDLGPLTILVNNAGVSWRGTLDTYDARMRRVRDYYSARGLTKRFAMELGPLALRRRECQL